MRSPTFDSRQRAITPSTGRSGTRRKTPLSSPRLTSRTCRRPSGPASTWPSSSRTKVGGGGGAPGSAASSPERPSDLCPRSQEEQTQVSVRGRRAKGAHVQLQSRVQPAQQQLCADVLLLMSGQRLLGPGRRFRPGSSAPGNGRETREWMDDDVARLSSTFGSAFRETLPM